MSAQELQEAWSAGKLASASTVIGLMGSAKAAAAACCRMPKPIRSAMLQEWATWPGLPDASAKGAKRDFTRIFAAAEIDQHPSDTPSGAAAQQLASPQHSPLYQRCKLLQELGLVIDARLGCEDSDELASLLHQAPASDLRDAALRAGAPRGLPTKDIATYFLNTAIFSPASKQAKQPRRDAANSSPPPAEPAFPNSPLRKRRTRAITSEAQEPAPARAGAGAAESDSTRGGSVPPIPAGRLAGLSEKQANRFCVFLFVFVPDSVDNLLALTPCAIITNGPVAHQAKVPSSALDCQHSEVWFAAVKN